jgi:histidinol dehydrogenase
MSTSTRSGPEGREGLPDTGAELRLFAEGRVSELAAEAQRHLLDRTPADQPGIAAAVAGILDDVRARGDAALREMAERFDGVRLDALEVPAERWREALAGLPMNVRSALQRAARNIRRFHTAQRPPDVTVEVEPGVRITRTWWPLGRVGVYAPGGRAAYPSSVLMGVVPARAAGVGEIVVCSPPGPTGVPPAEVLAACAIGEADRLFAVGGAGAVAALALGTESVPAVDGIVGPGNRWGTAATRQVAGRLVIDSPAGPSEVLVLADDTANGELVAHELLAQAEHDPEAACVLVTTSPRLAHATRDALARLLRDTPRREVASAALSAHGGLLLTDTLEEALAFAEAYAPEHLSVMTADATRDARSVRSAGTTFVGSAASVAFGDYLTGANHVLPTAGRARSFSGLSTLHFLRASTVQEIDPQGAAAMAEDVAVLAAAEGLPAHGAAVLARRLP